MAGRVAVLVVGDARLFIVDEDLAGRTWFPDDGRIVFGADLAWLAGDGTLQVRYNEATGHVSTADGQGLMETGCPAPPPLPGLPALVNWHKQECPERTSDGDGWQPLPDGPRSHEDLGRLYGYVWYRAEFESDAEVDATVFAPMISTRLTVYANGVYGGTRGELTRFVEFCGYRHPADALQQDQVVVPLRRGINTFAFLSDHLGRWFNGKPDFQGLRGPVYLGARRMNLGAAVPFAPAPVSDEAFRALYDKEYRLPTPLPGIDITVEVPPETDGYLILPSGLTHVAVSVDGRHVAGLPKAKYPFSTVQLPAWVGGRRIVLRIQCEAGVAFAPALEHVNLFLAPRRKALRNWAWKPGGEWPGFAGAATSAANVETCAQGEGWEGLMPDQKPPVGTGAKPAYYLAAFAKPERDLPLFLNIGKLHKGQLFLNGHNLGRFWQVGGHHQGNGVQSRFYLPRPWLRENNTLAVFEEYGLPPHEVSLTWGVSSNPQTLRL